MPKFITRRWHGNHMIFAMCFILVLLLCLSLVTHWFYGLVGLVFFGLLAYVLYRAEHAFRTDFIDYVASLNNRVKSVGQRALEQLPVGIVLYNDTGKIEWANPFIQELSPSKQLIGMKVEDAFKELREKKEKQTKPFQIQVREKTLEVLPDYKKRIYFFRDISPLVELEKRYAAERGVLGFLHMDNLDEAEQGLTDQESTQLISNISGAISKWALEHNITLKRIDTDKMFFVTQNQSLEKLIQTRFDILDVVREITRKNKIPITLSIGIASIGNNTIEKSKNAQAALDMALARGGDQAAVRNGEKILFFGGKTNALEKRTRVRARVISHAMRNLIRDSERVLIMGHSQPDMDALGAAIGVARFSLANDRDAYIVLDEGNHFIDRLLEGIKEHDYHGEHLITPEKALQWIDDPDTLLVIVDTHKPSLAMSPVLLERAQRIVVIDHHRRGEDFVEDPVLVYLEPYASSTCELVTELLQYQENDLGMDTLEATAIFAGIVVDTRNFAIRAGSRTFEAASFLRRHGADLAMVQALLKEDLDHYVKRAEIIKNTEVLFDAIAIAVGEQNESYDQLMIAQAADTILNMQGVVASFVIAPRHDNVISVSARSQGDLNVQVIMERMGGGGHLTHAACQMKDLSVEETKAQLIAMIKEVSLGGELE